MILSLVLSLTACGEAEEATAESTAEAVDECAKIVWTPVCNCRVTVDLRGLAPELTDYSDMVNASYVMVAGEPDVSRAALCPLSLEGVDGGQASAGVEDGIAVLNLTVMDVVGAVMVDAWLTGSTERSHLYLDVSPEYTTDKLSF